MIGPLFNAFCCVQQPLNYVVLLMRSDHGLFTGLLYPSPSSCIFLRRSSIIGAIHLNAVFCPPIIILATILNVTGFKMVIRFEERWEKCDDL
jgi:hypothetical protein